MFVAVVLFIIDVIIPFTSPLVIQIASVHALVWSVWLSVYWFISSSLTANLYERFCYRYECDREEIRFVILPIMGFLSMLAWVSVIQLLVYTTYHITSYYRYCIPYVAI